jgi:hypothetical protein
MGDKSAAILNNRPITIHKFSFESGITTSYPSGIEDEAPVLSPGNLVTNSDVVRITCIEGFNANLRLWQNASDLLLELRLMQDRNQQDLSMSNLQPLISAQEKDRLDALYVRFITCLDDLPPYLQSYTFAALADESRETTKQFLIQCANLQVSIHCLRMVITQKLENLPYYKSDIGHSDLRKTEIARDMLRVIQEAPFWSLQVNGEPYVSPLTHQVINEANEMSLPRSRRYDSLVRVFWRSFTEMAPHQLPRELAVILQSFLICSRDWTPKPPMHCEILLH